MANRFVLDTHALVWYVEGSARLSSAAKAIMDDPASEMILPAVALAEAIRPSGVCLLHDSEPKPDRDTSNLMLLKTWTSR